VKYKLIYENRSGRIYHFNSTHFKRRKTYYHPNLIDQRPQMQYDLKAYGLKVPGEREII